MFGMQRKLKKHIFCLLKTIFHEETGEELPKKGGGFTQKSSNLPQKF